MKVYYSIIVCLTLQEKVIKKTQHSISTAFLLIFVSEQQGLTNYT